MPKHLLVAIAASLNFLFLPSAEQNRAQKEQSRLKTDDKRNIARQERFRRGSIFHHETAYSENQFIESRINRQKQL